MAFAFGSEHWDCGLGRFKEEREVSGDGGRAFGMAEEVRFVWDTHLFLIVFFLKDRGWMCDLGMQGAFRTRGLHPCTRQ